MSQQGEPFDAERFRKEMQECLDIASGIRACKEVRAVVVEQAGRQCLAGRCPECREVALLSGEGKHLCRRCQTWLKYVRVGG